MIFAFVVAIILVSGLLMLAYIRRGNQPGGGDKKIATRTPPATRTTPKQKFDAIKDNYKSLPEVVASLRKSGLESSNLVIGIDFTKSNNWTGDKTFGGKSLHFLAHDDAAPPDFNDDDSDPPGFDDAGDDNIQGMGMNPYEHVISLLGQILESFDDDNIIPTYGFGDLRTKDKSVFPLHDPQTQGLEGFEQVIEAYHRVVPTLKFSGPTSFAPLIEKAIEHTQRDGGYHILLIIADGQVTNPDVNIAAIVRASHFPLSIIMVGVGDGPWDEMKNFDDNLPQRQFDNFQFVSFAEIMNSVGQVDHLFALNVLMEIPEQYQIIRRLKLLK